MIKDNLTIQLSIQNELSYFRCRAALTHVSRNNYNSVLTDRTNNYIKHVYSIQYFTFTHPKSIMLISCVSVIRNQIHLTRFFRSSPFQWNERGNNLKLIHNRNEKRAFWILSFFHFLYISLAVLVQWLVRMESVETSMLSLAFTAVLIASAVMKVMLIQKPKEILLLVNGLILFENKTFGEE
jgi:hypothetical protein